jgi:hypothetical protein
VDSATFLTVVSYLPVIALMLVLVRTTSLRKRKYAGPVDLDRVDFWALVSAVALMLAVVVVVVQSA